MEKKQIRQRNPIANTLALVIVMIGVFTVLIAFFAINFSQITSLHKEAQTAIDASALQAAKDMSRVVVDCPLGRLALVDDVAGSNSYPIQSINKVLASLRLDALIANRLNNKTILYLVKNDIDQAHSAMSILKQRITASANGQGGAYDKDGKVINIKQNAEYAYSQNSRRQGNTGELPENFKVIIGGITPSADLSKTGLPVPNPQNIDYIGFDNSNSYIENNQCYYKADVALAVPGLSGSTVKLGALGPEPRLIGNSAFREQLANDELVVAAQVSGDEKINKFAEAPQSAKGRKKGKNQGSQVDARLHAVASAQCGGRNYLPPTGTLVVSFPQGFPSNPTSGALTFNSVQSIINASQLDPSQSAPKSAYSNWNADSVGNWFITKGGPVPGSGNSRNEPFKGLHGRGDDDPSVALAFLTYDWLRSLSLRPNAQSVINALKFDYKEQYGKSGDSKNPTRFTASEILMPAVYAGNESSQNVTSAILYVTESGETDPRNMLKWDDNPQAYQRQQARMWGYIPADAILPAQAPLIQVTPGGDVVSVNGQPVRILHEIDNKMSFTNRYGVIVFDATNEILGKLSKEREASDKTLKELENQRQSGGDASNIDAAINARKDKIREEIFRDYPRVAAAYVNSTTCIRTTAAMRDNLKVLTGGGVQKINDNHYRLMDTDFYPASQGASIKDILGTEVVSTGQDPAAPIRDWCALPIKTGKNAQSQLVFFKRTQEPVISRTIPSDNDWMQPALAQTTIPPNNIFKFLFTVSGGSDQMGSGVVELKPSTTSPFAAVPTIEGQVHYQNVSAISVPATNDPNQQLQWQVQARDLNANAYPESSNSSSPPNPNSAASHYSSISSPDYNSKWCSPSSNQACPSLAAEWAVTCPIAPPPPPPNLPDSTSVPAASLPCGVMTGRTVPALNVAWTPYGVIVYMGCGWEITCHPPIPYHS